MTDPALRLSADTLAQLAADSARAGDVQTLALVLAGGVPVGTTTPRGESLLMLAAYHDRLDAVRLLLKSGADPDQRDAKGQTPLTGVAFKGLVDVAADPRGRRRQRQRRRPTAARRSASPRPSTAPTWCAGCSTMARRATCAMPPAIAPSMSLTPSAPPTRLSISIAHCRLSIPIADCPSRLPIVDVSAIADCRFPDCRLILRPPDSICAMLALDQIQTVALAGLVLFVGYGVRRLDSGARHLQHPGAGRRRPADGDGHHGRPRLRTGRPSRSRRRSSRR